MHSEGDDSACEEDVEEEEEADLIMPPDKDKVLSNLPPRTHNFIVRGLSGSLLITSFVGLVCMGPSGLLTLVSFDLVVGSFNRRLYVFFEIFLPTVFFGPYIVVC